MIQYLILKFLKKPKYKYITVLIIVFWLLSCALDATSTKHMTRQSLYIQNNLARHGLLIKRFIFLGKEENVLFNDALNTFYLRLYGVGKYF